MAKKELSESEKIFKRLNKNAYYITLFAVEIQKLNKDYLIKLEKANEAEQQKLNNEIRTPYIKGKPISYYHREFESDFELLYQESRKDFFFWQYCQFDVYKKTINEREKDFLIKFDDANKLSFYENELEILNCSKKESGKSRLAGLSRPSIINNKPEPQFAVFSFDYERKGYTFLKFLSDELKMKIDYTQTRKIEYIEKLIVNQKNRQSETQEIQEPEIFLDYSNNSKVERIVFLHELGVLEYLQHKMNKELHGFSANKLAEIISTFTGIEQSTAQPYLNPIFTKDAIQKNNPLTKINLEKVKNKLKNIGFNTSKSA